MEAVWFSTHELSWSCISELSLGTLFPLSYTTVKHKEQSDLFWCQFTPQIIIALFSFNQMFNSIMTKPTPESYNWGTGTTTAVSQGSDVRQKVC